MRTWIIVQGTSALRHGTSARTVHHASVVELSDRAASVSVGAEQELARSTPGGARPLGALGSRAKWADTAFSRTGEAVLVGITSVVTGVWAWLRLDEGWIAHDDGAFAQSAVRVLHGQLPHREFVELYTGAMTFLNAGVFYLLGEDLFYLRIPLFLLFLGLVPCVYYLARQFVGPIPAVLTALAAVTWGYPVYPTPMPSWYVLLFSLYGAAALVRWRQTGHRRWLVAAGLMGGLAISVKIIGVYYVAAVVLFLVCCSPSHEEGPDRSAVRRGRLTPAWLLAAAGGVGFAALVVVAAFGSHIGPLEVVNLIAPIAVVAAVVVVWPTLTRSRSPGSESRLAGSGCSPPERLLRSWSCRFPTSWRGQCPT